MAGSKAARRGREQRAFVRFDKQMRVRTEHGAGSTHNISAQGVYFETDGEPRPGALVDLFIEYTLDGRPRLLLCEAKVLRVEPKGGRTGVAARLLSPFFAGEECANAPQPRTDLLLRRPAV